MRPVIAIVGRPNVGKSTLFNVLTRSRDALVADFPGLTRDRQYGTGKVGERPFLVVDTGGLSGDEEGIDVEMAQQVMSAIGESDAVLFLVDGRGGLMAADAMIANHLRQCGKPVWIIVNKIDRVDPEIGRSDFFSLGMGEPLTISAAHNRGVHVMIDEVLATFPPPEGEIDTLKGGIKVAIVGRPNVGKSTLVNRILGEDRVVVFDMPGTTRDSIFIPFERDGQEYTLIDTAGVRRRARVKETVEKFSVIKTLQAISEAHVVIMVLDAREGISDQDAHIIGFTLDAGRAMVLAVNKWDGLSNEQRERVKHSLEIKLSFLNFAKIHFISALHGSGVGNLFESVNTAYHSAMRDISTSALTEMLQWVVSSHQPPMVRGRRIKLRYAHQGGKNPPIIVIHGNQTEDVPASYQRYLENTFRKQLKLEGTPIRIEFKSGDNPYAARTKTLTSREMAKKRQLTRTAIQSEKGGDKNIKGTRGAKGSKGGVGAKSTTGVRNTKSTTGVRNTKSATGVKSAKSAKGVKSVKNAKGVKNNRGDRRK